MTGQNGQEEDRPRAAPFITVPRGSVAATCGPATSLPRSTTWRSTGKITSLSSKRIDHAGSPEACARTQTACRPTRRVLDAATLRSKRLRFGYDQQEVIATIAGNVFGKDVQAYPKYGSEKKGLPTTYYLTIAETHINMHSELEKVELLCVNDPSGDVEAIDAARASCRAARSSMQSPYQEPEDVWTHLQAANKKTIRDKKIHVYFCDMVRIAREVASEPDLQMRMQGIVLLGAFYET